MDRIINGIGSKYIERRSYMIPCLNKESLKLLVATADERYQYSSEYFRNTHFPQVMHRYHGNQLIAEITEIEFFEELIEADSSGNRIFLVFGSTGSGKSELLCWIKDKWIHQNINRPVIRISRSELNPQVLIKKCFEKIGIPLKISIDENKWDLLLKKPVTLINQIVWTTLAETFQTDDEIIPLALMLRPIIEKNITDFTKQIERGQIKNSLEIIHRKQFEEILSSTTLTLNIEYESFRHTLSQKLDHFLFEGWDIGSLFKHMSEHLKANNIRPLLLIDDLVQSVNIYASELLDQLITLEESNWDVVIGLTPGSIQDSKRGVDLTKRIQNLDTIDDRVKKLWLSDESGKDFYNLNRSQVVPYMANYLKQLKSTQGFTCSVKCSHFQNCRNLVQSQASTRKFEDDLPLNLLPFNSYMIKRVYDAIPIGKGKLRYMILNSKEIIRFFQKGNRELLSRVVPLVNRETFADHSDLLVKTFSEWYVQPGGNRVVLSSQLFEHFGYDIGDSTINLQPLGNQTSIKEPSSIIETDKTADSLVIRDWVEGKRINTELLEPIRYGVAALVHDVRKGVFMARQFTPRTAGIIQRKEVSNRTRYPITFVEDNGGLSNGIEVSRGYSALEIKNFQQLKPTDKAKLFQKISNELDTARWIYQADSLHSLWLEKLEEQLGVTLPSFAYNFKHWVGGYEILNRTRWAKNIKTPFTPEVIHFSEQIYQDWFMLRDNMIDPIALRKIEKMNFDNWIRGYNPTKEMEQYEIGEVSLFVFLSELKEKYLHYYETLSHTFQQTIKQRGLMIPFLLSTQERDFHLVSFELERLLGKSQFNFMDLIEYSKLEETMESHNIIEKFLVVDELREEVKELKNQYDSHARYLVSITNQYGDYLNHNRIDNNTSWVGLNEEKEKYTVLIEELKRLNSCLALSPKMALEFILKTNIESTEVLQIKRLWAYLIESGRKLLELESVGQDLIHSILGWQSIDFFSIKNHAAVHAQKESYKIKLLEILCNDLGYKDISAINQLIDCIEANKEIRPAIRRQLLNLLEHGYCTLPPVQWRKLLEDMKELFPRLYKFVEIRLVASHNLYEKEG